MIMVTGATGNVGREIVGTLVARGEKVRALTRDPARANLPDGVDVVAGDYGDADSLHAAFTGVRTLFFLFLPALGDPGPLFRIAREAGVERVVLLSSSAVGAGYSMIGRLYGSVEDAVREEGLAWTFVRPGFFMTNALEWTRTIREERVVRAPRGDFDAALIDPRDIAAVAVEALSSDGHIGRVHTLTGPRRVSTVEQVRVLSRVLGEEIRFEELTDDAARAEMGRTMPPPVVDTLLSFYAEPHPVFTDVSPVVPELTGRQARTFEQWATDHAGLFR